MKFLYRIKNKYIFIKIIVLFLIINILIFFFSIYMVQKNSVNIVII